MRRFLRSGLVAFAGLLLAVTAVAATEVCRSPYIAGMEHRIDAIHAVVGENVTSKSRIKLYISQQSTSSGNKLFIQSNFLSANPDMPSGHSESPTKLLVEAEKLGSLDATLANVIFWGNLPPDARQQISAAKSTTEIFLDPSILDDAGRPPFDLSGAKEIHLANDRQSLTSGKIETLNLRKPPPALIERISGCCLKGRPAGRGLAIQRALASRRVDKTTAGLLSMVVDSATTETIKGSAILRSAAGRTASRPNDSWEKRVNSALDASKGKTLIVLSHISDGSVVVEDAGGKALFRVRIDDLHRKAEAKGVNLILLGCDTAKDAVENRVPVGVVGKYNTQFAAERIGTALENSKTAEDFLSSIAAEGLQIVAQEGAWSNRGIGAGVFTRPKTLMDRAHRVLRVWFMGKA